MCFMVHYLVMTLYLLHMWQCKETREVCISCAVDKAFMTIRVDLSVPCLQGTFLNLSRNMSLLPNNYP